MSNRSEILDRLSTQDRERLLEWFLESAADGWRPLMRSWSTEVSGRYEPFWLSELLERAGGLMSEVVRWRKERGD